MSRTVLASLISVVVAAALAAPVTGAPPGPVQASLDSQASLVDGGAAVLVRVTARCAGGSDVLEAFVYVTQDGAQSPFAPIPVRCGGRARTYDVLVSAPEGFAFHTGSAAGSGYVLVDKRGNVTSASPSATLTVG